MKSTNNGREKIKIAETLARLYREIEPDYVFFVSGLIVSASTNIYTSIYLSDSVVRNFWILLLSSLFLLLGSVFLVILSLNLRALRNLSVDQAPTFYKHEERRTMHLKLLGENLGRLLLYSLIALVASIVGFLLLAFSS